MQVRAIKKNSEWQDMSSTERLDSHAGSVALAAAGEFRQENLERDYRRETETPLMTVKEVASWLQLSESTVHKLLKRRAIPGFKPTAMLGKQSKGVWRFSREQLAGWVTEYSSKARLGKPRG